jgi:hypothetical protein
MARSIQDIFGDHRNVDPFRLAILGFASIEHRLNEALAEAFDGELPDELRRSHFKARVALARALTLMPNDFRGPLGRLKKLRDDFAHGKLDDLTPSEAAGLYAAIKELAPDVETHLPGLKDEQPEIILATFLIILEVGLNAVFEDARDRRARQEEAMREWWERRRPSPTLTQEQIADLLKEDESSDD